MDRNALERMRGVVLIKEHDSFKASAKRMVEDLKHEGFENSDIKLFLKELLHESL